MRLGEAVDRYTNWRRAQGAHFESQAYALRHFCRCVGEAVDCDEDPGDRVSAFLAGAAPASGNRAFLHSTLAGFFRYAITYGFATRSPLPAETPKAPKSTPPYIHSREELHCLLNAVTIYRKRINQLEPHTFRAQLLLL